MRKNYLILLIIFLAINTVKGQVLKNTDQRILMHGVVFDARTFNPLTGSQIMINRKFSAISDTEGKFALYVMKGDTVIFTRLGYKPAVLNISDTLSGKEFIAGVYMHSDTLLIDEVVIIPRYSNLKLQIFSSKPEANIEIENAKYNLEVSAYQGKIGQSRLGDPSMNYEVLRQQMRNDAYSKGQIPSDRIAGLSPFMLIPAAYLLLNGLPDKPSSMEPQITDQEVEQIHRKYLETLRKK
jgi:hypothetical protein